MTSRQAALKIVANLAAYLYQMDDDVLLDMLSEIKEPVVRKGREKMYRRLAIEYRQLSDQSPDDAQLGIQALVFARRAKIKRFPQ